MKKILSLTMALAMIGTALTGCGSKDTATQTPAENTQQTAPVQQEQSQTEKALALINTFATGDTDTANRLRAVSVSPVAKVLMSASAFSVWLCSCWTGAVC